MNELGALDVLIVDTEKERRSLEGKRAFLEVIKASTTEMDECDVVVPRVRVSEYINFTYELAKNIREFLVLVMHVMVIFISIFAVMI